MSLMIVFMAISACMILTAMAMTVTALVFFIEWNKKDNGGSVSAVPRHTGGAQSERVVVLRILNDGRIYQIKLNNPVVLGRSIPDRVYYNDLGVGESTSISRQQCQLYERNGQVFLVNLSRVNMTRLNDRIIMEPTQLRSGDIIQISGIMIQVGICR